MSIYHSRHTHYSTKRAPHEKRTILLYAEGEWKGKWYRCWNCGFINNADRAQVAATFEGGDKAQVFEYDDLTPSIWGLQDSRYTFLTLDFPQSINLMQLDANGNVITPHVEASVKITGGCALCGCMNYR